MEKWAAVAADWEQNWQSEYKDMEHSSSGCIYNKTPTPPAQGSLQKRGRSDRRARGSGICCGAVLLLSSVIPTKSHQRGCLHTSGTRTASMGMPEWTGKTKKPEPCTQNYKQLRNFVSQRSGLPQRRENQWVIQYQMISPEKHTYK